METQLLIKQRNTPPQVGLNGKDRMENIKDSFAVAKKTRVSFKKRTIILFDDVWTTGSTLNETQEVLKKNGFKKVFGLTICR